MNIFLVLPFLLFLYTCHGNETGGSSPLGILPTKKWQKEVETPREVSCPDPTDINPCVCINSGTLTMDCSNVQDEEQLRKVFSAFFPTTEFFMFKMRHNKVVKVLEDGVFHNVSFEFLDIYESILETVEIDALTPSLSTLTQISIQFCMLEIFPVETLAEFTKLQNLFLPGNKIHTFPPPSSSSLRAVDLGYNVIMDLTPDVFSLLTAVELLYLDGNNLTEILKETFTGLAKLTLLSLHGNNIYNVDVDAFKGVAGPANINIDNNALTALPEEVWRPVMKRSIFVYLAGNDLVCDCGVAWLVRDPQLQTMAYNARCADGTMLTDLNPADFDICS